MKRRASIRLSSLRSILLVIAAVLSGCTGNTYNTTNDDSQDSTIVTIIGTVAEVSSLQTVAGAHLEMKDAVSSAVIAASDAGADGRFFFSAVPVGSYKMRVTASGYATSEFRVGVASIPFGQPAVENIGYVVLGKPFDLTVVATDQGVPVAGVPVTAIMASQCTGYYISEPIANSSSTLIISSTTGTAGTAVLKGLNQCANYQILNAAFDSDGDGVYDYVSGSQYYYFMSSYDPTLSIALTSVPQYWYSDPQQVVASNTRLTDPAIYSVKNITDAGSLSYSMVSSYHAIGSSEPIRIVFKYPVTLSDGLTVSYSENLRDPDADGNGSVDAGFPFETEVPVSAAMDPTGTILTITPPPEGFPVNRQIKIRGSVATVQGGQVQVKEIRSITNAPDIVYIANDGLTGLSPVTTITADNYNGNNGMPGNVYLEFPEYVKGTMRVISYTRYGSVTLVNGSAIAGFGEIVYTDGGTTGLCSGACGSGAGVFYRINTGLSLSDGDLITVSVDVMDIEGNRLNQEFQLTVQ